ncbi:MAG TPA: hypothetical protein VF590_28250 [Isosphaeraceae bacterium]
MTQPRRRCAVVAAVAGLLVAIGGGLSWSQDAATQTQDAQGKRKAEVASGVIVKVEAVAKEREREKNDSDASDDDGSKKDRRRGRQVRVSINTTAVWRDWVRDQAIAPQKADVPPDTSRDAAQGANSVATKGQPKADQNVVIVLVGPGTRVQTRYRSSTDEASLGATTPEGAAKAEAGQNPDAGQPKQRERREAGNGSVEDLKTGLFVEAEYRGNRDRNRALRVTILRPVGGPDTPAAESTTSPVAPTTKGSDSGRTDRDKSDR